MHYFNSHMWPRLIPAVEIRQTISIDFFDTRGHSVSRYARIRQALKFVFVFKLIFLQRFLPKLSARFFQVFRCSSQTAPPFSNSDKGIIQMIQKFSKNRDIRLFARFELF